MSEWINLDYSELPPVDDYVLVTDGEGVVVAYWGDMCWGFPFESLRGYVTHWMPLPEPPKE